MVGREGGGIVYVESTTINSKFRRVGEKQKGNCEKPDSYNPLVFKKSGVECAKLNKCEENQILRAFEDCHFFISESVLPAPHLLLSVVPERVICHGSPQLAL